MPTDAEYEALLIALGESLADIKARLEVIEEVLLQARLISREEMVARVEAKYDECNPINLAMDRTDGLGDNQS